MVGQDFAFVFGILVIWLILRVSTERWRSRFLSWLTRLSEIVVIVSGIWYIFDIPNRISSIPAIQTGGLAFLDTTILPILLVLASLYLAIRLVPELHFVRSWLGGIAKISVARQFEVRIRARKDLKKIEDVLSRAKSELIVESVTGEVLRQVSGQLVDLLKKNVSITVVLSKPAKEDDPNDPQWTVLHKAEKALNCENASNSIHNTLGTLDRQVRGSKDLTEKQRDNLKVLVNDELPLHSIIAIDPKEKRGQMQVELYRHGEREPKSRYNMLLTMRSDPEAYEYYLHSLTTLVESSTAWVWNLF